MDLDFLFISTTGDWSPHEGWGGFSQVLRPSVRGTHASKIAKRGAASIVMVPAEIEGGRAPIFRQSTTTGAEARAEFYTLYAALKRRSSTVGEPVGLVMADAGSRFLRCTVAFAPVPVGMTRGSAIRL
jgi:hypothetical protein